MARNPTTTFRLDEAFLQDLEGVAKHHEVSRADVVRTSVALLATLFEQARQDALADLGALRKRYGDEARLIVSVSESSDGGPEARMVIDGVAPDDARAFPVLTDGAVEIFLDVTNDARPPLLARLGTEALLIPRPQLPIGTLPWPADPTRGIVIRLGDVERIINPPAAPQFHALEPA